MSDQTGDTAERLRSLGRIISEVLLKDYALDGVMLVFAAEEQDGVVTVCASGGRTTGKTAKGAEILATLVERVSAAHEQLITQVASETFSLRVELEPTKVPS